MSKPIQPIRKKEPNSNQERNEQNQVNFKFSEKIYLNDLFA